MTFFNKSLLIVLGTLTSGMGPGAYFVELNWLKCLPLA